MPLDGTLYEPDDETLRILCDALARIRDPKHWCQNTYGHWQSDNDPVCSIGALYSVIYKSDPCAPPQLAQSGKHAFQYLLAAAKQLGFPDVARLNDNSDHDTTKTMFNRAQELRQAKIMEEVQQ